MTIFFDKISHNFIVLKQKKNLRKANKLNDEWETLNNLTQFVEHTKNKNAI